MRDTGVRKRNSGNWLPGLSRGALKQIVGAQSQERPAFSCA
jgi:hypothetical protein